MQEEGDSSSALPFQSTSNHACKEDEPPVMRGAVFLEEHLSQKTMLSIKAAAEQEGVTRHSFNTWLRAAAELSARHHASQWDALMAYVSQGVASGAIEAG